MAISDSSSQSRIPGAGLRRRTLLAGAGAGLAGALLAPSLRADGDGPLSRTIPSSGHAIPAVGLGSWITFNVGTDAELRANCVAVMEAFFAEGGTVIDSSPMYGSAPEVIGYGLEHLNAHDRVFSAEKVWTRDGDAGASQIAVSAEDWRLQRFDLLQVHNLLAWREHLALLFDMKEAGAVRYVGITTSHGRRLEALERIMREQPIDFVQLTYNPVDRHAEQRLLPLAEERGIAVLVNRPFRGGKLTQRLENAELPAVAGELEAESWAQLILKFILAHPAVTCPIPATTQAAHARENMRAAREPLPDTAQRRAIADAIAAA